MDLILLNVLTIFMWHPSPIPALFKRQTVLVRDLRIEVEEWLLYHSSTLLDNVVFAIALNEIVPNDT